MRVCIWLLVILQLLLLPPLAAQSLRGAADADENTGGSDGVSADAAAENDVEKAADMEILDAPQRRTGGEDVDLAANISMAIDQFQRDDRERGLIIGGRDASQDDSFVVSLQDKNGRHFCGASLISKDCVLTAAHCTTAVTGEEGIKVVIGRHDLSNKSVGEILSVRREVLHPKYDVSKANLKWDYDFALIFLSRPTMTRAKIIKLNRDPKLPQAGVQVNVLGYGDTDESNEVKALSDILQTASLRTVSNTQCDAMTGTYGSYSVSFQGHIQGDMMCAKNRKRDSCQGDSGGPLVMGNVQMGITSWGVGCNVKELPGVYARVSKAYGWIRRQMCSRSMYPSSDFNCEPW